MIDANSIFEPTNHELPFQTKSLTRNQLLDLAVKVVPDVQILINMVSQRVRQLSQGQRSLVEVTPRMTLSMIALKEIADGKLYYKASAPVVEA